MTSEALGVGVGAAGPSKSRGRSPLLILSAAIGIVQVSCYVVPRLRPGLAGVIPWMFGAALVPLSAASVFVLSLFWGAIKRPVATLPRGQGLLFPGDRLRV